MCAALPGYPLEEALVFTRTFTKTLLEPYYKLRAELYLHLFRHGAQRNFYGP